MKLRTPFKLGTFRTPGREFLGLVLQDTQVDRHRRRQRRPSSAVIGSAHKVRPPADMKELIARYDEDRGPETAAACGGRCGARVRRPMSMPSLSLDVLPPVRPAVILNAGANYPEHAQGIVAEAARAAAAAGRRPGNAGAPGGRAWQWTECGSAAPGGRVEAGLVGTDRG